MAKDTAEEQVAQTFTGSTLDAWSWIARARAAAASATRPQSGEPKNRAGEEAPAPADPDRPTA